MEIYLLHLLEFAYGNKGHNIWNEIPKTIVVRHILNYEEMFPETPIYIRYVVLTIVIFTSMLSTELFYLTQLRSFIGCYFEYLPLFIPYRFAIYP